MHCKKLSKVSAPKQDLRVKSFATTVFGHRAQPECTKQGLTNKLSSNSLVMRAKLWGNTSALMKNYWSLRTEQCLVMSCLCPKKGQCPQQCRNHHRMNCRAKLHLWRIQSGPNTNMSPRPVCVSISSLRTVRICVKFCTRSMKNLMKKSWKKKLKEFKVSVKYEHWSWVSLFMFEPAAALPSSCYCSVFVTHVTC